ncbi:hypothetical protein AB0K47_19215 [Streptomyces tirandamycinicus]|uniref:hypothetical protein n=1 Tax=Streptomyces tirandamycinicus TaxID=2174846 RepID=UPI003430B5F9
MSELEKAAREAVEAQANSEHLALIAAVLQAQHLVQQQPCQHPPAPVSSGSAVKWVGIGVGASVFLISVAVSAVAVAISAVALTICVLVLRGMWTDYRKGK